MSAGIAYVCVSVGDDRVRGVANAFRSRSPEDLILYKAVAWRDRDRGDIERLLVMHQDAIDLPRVRRIVAEFAEALNEPERVGELDALIARAVGSGPGG